MNKHRYRVLFSKTLQRFIVTSELAKTTTSGNTERGDLKCGQSSAYFSFSPSLQSLTFAVFCALGFVSEAVGVPVIASGGAGKLEHFYDVLTAGKADAVLAASVFHYGEFTIKEVKDYLKNRGVEVRL